MVVGLTRRAFCLGGAGLVAGCAHSATGAGRAVPTPSPVGSPTSSTTGSAGPGPRPTPTLPAVTPWHPAAADLEPTCKLAAVRRIERAGNDPHSALQVIDVQYGGLLTDTASVLVVSRSWQRRGGHVVPGGHTFDVRLSRSGSTWRMTAVHPSRPGPPRAPSALVRRVLVSPRIVLPPAARRDVRSGLVHDSVLTAMLTLAASYRINVSVVRSGHPILVFGTDRPSDHPLGRAFDTWAIDGHPVVDAPRSLVTDYMHAVAASGSSNVGGPVLLGAAPQFFTDATHHDHVHAGFAT